MTNLEKYEQAYVAAFNVTVEEAHNLKYQSIPAWDSVGHMGLISELEDAFDIMMESDDIVTLSDFEKGKEILTEKYDVKFD